MHDEQSFDEIVAESAKWALLHNNRTPNPLWDREVQVAVALVFNDTVVLNTLGYLTVEAAAPVVCWRMPDGFEPADVPEWVGDVRERLARDVAANLADPMVQIILGTRLDELAAASARRDGEAAKRVLATIETELAPIGRLLVDQIVTTVLAGVTQKPAQGEGHVES